MVVAADQGQAQQIHCVGGPCIQQNSLDAPAVQCRLQTLSQINLQCLNRGECMTNKPHSSLAESLLAHNLKSRKRWAIKRAMKAMIKSSTIPGKQDLKILP